MQYGELIARLVEALAWPGAIIAVARMFRDDLRNLLSRLREISFAEKWSAMFASPSPDVGDHGESRIVGTDKSANFFWIGNDMMWTAAALLGGSDAVDVHRGMTQVLYHLSEAGYGSSDIAAGVKQEQEKLPTSGDIAGTERTRVAGLLRELAQRFGSTLLTNQRTDAARTN